MTRIPYTWRAGRAQVHWKKTNKTKVDLTPVILVTRNESGLILCHQMTVDWQHYRQKTPIYKGKRVFFSFPGLTCAYKHALVVQNDCICTKPRKQAYRYASTNLNHDYATAAHNATLHVLMPLRLRPWTLLPTRVGRLLSDMIK